MASSGVVKFAYAMLICMVVVVVANAPPRAEASTSTISCDQLTTSLSSCLGYVKGTGGASPPDTCCDGVKSLNNAANTTSDRKAACKCVVKLINKHKITNDSLVSGLPSSCGVTLPFPVGKSADCKKAQ